MLEIFHTPKFDFMRVRGYAYVFSGLILAASIGFLAHHAATSKNGDLLNYGIDFRGGSLFQVGFKSAPDVSKLRSELASAGFANASIQAYGEPAENQVLIRVSEQLEEHKDL